MRYLPSFVTPTSRVCALLATGVLLAASRASAQQGNDPPTAIIEVVPSSGTIVVNQTLSFDARRSSDPNGGALTYGWTFGDGQSATGSVTTHAYAADGRYTVRLKVTDAGGLFTQSARDVVIGAVTVNREPVALITTGPRTGVEGSTLTFDGRASYDLDNDALTYGWEITRSGGLIAAPSGAVITVPLSIPGVYEVVLTVSDPKGGVGVSDPETVTITEKIEPPPDPDDGDGDGEPTDPDAGQEVPDSADQRPPSMCGIGMLPAVFGVCLGLATAKRSRRIR